MKFSVPFDLLDKAMSIANANPVTNAFNDVCQYVLIETNSDKIVLTKSDLDIYITADIPADIQTPGRALVHGDNFEKILKTYKPMKKGDDCLAVISSDNGKFSIAFSDNKKYKPAVLSTKDPDDFAEADEFKDEIASCEIIAATLKDYFAKNLIAISKIETNPEYSGVFLKFKGKDIEMTSSTRLEVAIIQATPLKTAYESGLTQAFSLIPRKTLDTAVRIIKGSDPVKVAISADMVKLSGTIEGVGFSIFNSTYQCDAPFDGAGMIPKTAKTVISIPTSALKNALAHMEAIMEKSMPNKISILADPAVQDVLILSCKTQLGEIPGLPIEAKLEKVSEISPLALNDQRLAALLRVVRSANLQISYDKAGGNCTFRGEDEPFFTMIAGSLEAKTTDFVKPSAEIKPIKASTSDTLEILEYDDLSTISDPDDVEASIEEIGAIEI